MAEPVVFENAKAEWTTATGGAYTEVPDVSSVSAPFSRAELDDAVMGDTLSVKYPGILDAPISVTCRQSLLNAGVDENAFNKLNLRTAFKFRLRPVDAAVTTDNPAYVWDRVRVFSVTPMDGAHGAKLENKIEIRAASGCTLTRASDS